MATMTHGSNWTGSNTQNTKSKDYTFSTGSKYIDKNIVFTVTAKDGSRSGGVSGSNITLSDTNSSGISVTGTGTTGEGWVSAGSSTATKYATGVTIPASKSFTVNDGIYTWTWTVDASGNVTIS